VAAAGATALMAENRIAGLALALLAFLGIGLGVGASGTSLLALLANRVAPDRRAAAASIVWVMMIAGFAVTAGALRFLLDPFSMGRLFQVTAGVAAVTLTLAAVAVWGVEGAAVPAATAAGPEPEAVPFGAALAEVWREPRARRFALFVFIAMLGYSAEELVLEPFAGSVLGMTPAQSASITGMQHAGALIGMIVVALAGSIAAKGRYGSMRTWTIGGCLGSAVGLGAVALAGVAGPQWPLQPAVLFLGAANGAFAVAAIGSMMSLAAEGGGGRVGLRMGLFGAAQAVAFALGGLIATTATDLARLSFGSAALAYALVFLAEAVLFVVASRLAADVFPARREAAELREPDMGVGAAPFAPGG
jgi:BCD family chlorophyll transporter-like MFS transporter